MNYQFCNRMVDNSNHNIHTILNKLKKLYQYSVINEQQYNALILLISAKYIEHKVQENIIQKIDSKIKSILR